MDLRRRRPTSARWFGEGAFACIPLAWLRPMGLTDLRVATVLAYHANKDGEAWPSLGLIARESGVATRHVRESIDRLEEMGALRRDPLVRRSMTYWLTPDPTNSPSTQVSTKSVHATALDTCKDERAPIRPPRCTDLAHAVHGKRATNIPREQNISAASLTPDKDPIDATLLHELISLGVNDRTATKMAWSPDSELMRANVEAVKVKMQVGKCKNAAAMLVYAWRNQRKLVTPTIRRQDPQKPPYHRQFEDPVPAHRSSRSEIPKAIKVLLSELSGSPFTDRHRSSDARVPRNTTDEQESS